ncbi:MAG: hypothetical protein WD341_09120 [Tistlia sp.]|uniref:hypothetical protein n=1 Tax=Tistlia sp. TaxID=3057121 RepID=UPI0034A32BC4
MVARIATGEIEDERSPTPGRAKSGRAGGTARAASLSEQDRKRIAEKAAAKRWHGAEEK